jgi:2,5-diamino-6-(ribosylamino)-4(3H)-pyrimidinone 5'-phosphate reductase
MASTTTPPQPQPPLPPLLNLPANHRASLAPYLPPHTSGSLDTSTSQTQPLPHLTLTYATSLDNAIALAPGVQTALSGPETKAMTHYLRSQHDAILIGANTAIIDDPSLTCRHEAVEDEHAESQHGGGPDAGPQVGGPIPIILDPSGRWVPWEESKILRLAREGRGKGPLWFVESTADSDAMGRVREAGGEILFLGPGLRRAEGGGVNWGILLEGLAAGGVRSVMVEGGAKVIMDLLRKENQKFVNSVVVTVAPVWLGAGGVAVCPPRGKGRTEVGRLEGVRWLPMGEDVVMAGRFGNGSR